MAGYMYSLGYYGALSSIYYKQSDGGVRPVVCLKASTPAYLGITSNTTDIVLK